MNTEQLFTKLTEFISDRAAQSDTFFTDRIDRLETSINGRIDSLEQRIDRLEMRFDALELRFDVLELCFDRLEKRFDTLEVSIKRYFDAAAETIAAGVDAVTDETQPTLKNHERRIRRLENNLSPQ